MDGLVWASIGSALPLYEMYWRPEKLLPLRYHAGWARTTSAPMLPGLLKPATIWSDVALRQVKEALWDRVPQRSGPAPPPWKSRNAPAAGTPAASTELALKGMRSPETRLKSPIRFLSASGFSGSVTVYPAPVSGGTMNAAVSVERFPATIDVLSAQSSPPSACPANTMA